MTKQIPVCTLADAAEFRAELEKRRPYALAVKVALMRGDIEGCAEAQRAMREEFNSASV